MLREIIRKQQAIIERLKRENELNQSEIRNLKETLDVLTELMRSMKNAA